MDILKLLNDLIERNKTIEAPAVFILIRGDRLVNTNLITGILNSNLEEYQKQQILEIILNDEE